MNSNFGDQERGHSAAEAHETEKRHKKTEAEPELRVTDKRRITPEAEVIPIEQDQSSQEDSPDGHAAVLSEIELLQARLKESEEKRIEAERQVRDFADRFRHAQTQLRAETDEQRARLQRTFDQKLEVARGDVLASLLDTLDNLKRAIVAAEKSDIEHSDFASLLEGVRATAAIFEAKMLSMGLSAVPAAGEKFNPELHEAVEIVPVSKKQDNQVIEEFQTGYKFGDRLLRPARVRVGRANG